MIEHNSAQEITAALNALMKGDPESAHAEADKLLLRRLQAIGEDDVVNAFLEADDRIGFWYA